MLTSWQFKKPYAELWEKTNMAKVIIKNGLCKLEIGLCKGKKLYDKRESEKAKTVEREIREKY